MRKNIIFLFCINLADARIFSGEFHFSIPFSKKAPLGATDCKAQID